MNKDKRRLPAMSGHPLLGRADDESAISAFSYSVGILTGAREQHLARNRGKRLEVKRTVILVETLIKPHLLFEKHAPDKRCCLIAVGTQHRSKRHRSRTD